jgi:uncharacterized protein (UPF0179 family)
MRLGVTYPIIDVGTAANDCAIVDNTHFAVHVQRKAGDGFNSKDSVAHCTMLNGGKVSEESWEGDAEAARK